MDDCHFEYITKLTQKAKHWTRGWDLCIDLQISMHKSHHPLVLCAQCSPSNSITSHGSVGEVREAERTPLRYYVFFLVFWGVHSKVKNLWWGPIQWTETNQQKHTHKINTINEYEINLYHNYKASTQLVFHCIKSISHFIILFNSMCIFATITKPNITM